MQQLVRTRYGTVASEERYSMVQREQTPLAAKFSEEKDRDERQTRMTLDEGRSEWIWYHLAALTRNTQGLGKATDGTIRSHL